MADRDGAFNASEPQDRRVQTLSPRAPEGLHQVPHLEDPFCRARTDEQPTEPEGDQWQGLTETALRGPVVPEDPNRESLESTYRSARRQSTGEAEPGELAVPEPVRHRRLTEEEKATAAPAGLSTPRGKETKAEQASGYSSLATEVYAVSWLIFWSFWGTLARIGVDALTLYPNTPFPSRVLWSNVGGTFVLGFLAEDRRLFRQEWGSPDTHASASEHGKVKKTIPLYIGLATGFCGSFTSFSSYMRDSFLAMANALPSGSNSRAYYEASSIPPRNGGFSFLAMLGILIVHPAASFAALQVGAQLALALQPVTPTLPFKAMRRIVDPIMVFVANGCWIGAVLLAIYPPGDDNHWRYRALFPLIFAPVGCLLRYYLAKYLNARIPPFPLGTFVANIFGSMVLAMAYDLQHSRGIGGSDPVSCTLLQGITEGFCGALTTVSTWIAEMHGLRRRNGWIYGVTSVAVAFAFLTVIMGTMAWTVGFVDGRCP